MAGFTTSLPLAIAITGYLLGCVAAIALAGAHRAQRNRKIRDPRFQVRRALDNLAQGAVIGGFAGGLVCAFHIATELAK